jgi:hypothetical protein
MDPKLPIQERDCVIEVAEIPDDCPPLIGQVPLEMLDFVVNPAGRPGRCQSELPLGPESTRNCSQPPYNNVHQAATQSTAAST